MHKFEERTSIVLENEGQKIFGILHRPIQKNPVPIVLICHGLAGHKAGRYRIYVLLSEKLSQAGIASLRIDFRGSGDSEGNFSDMTLESEVSDALSALKYIEKDKSLDKNRIGLFGRSVGGMVALITACQYKNIKSIATWAPLFDGDQWKEEWHLLQAPHISEETRMMRMRVNGQVPGSNFFKQLFTIQMQQKLAELAHVPFLNIHGEQDKIVITEHANRYKKSREKAHGQTKFILLPESDHDFTDPKEQNIALKETTQWFVHTL